MSNILTKEILQKKIFTDSAGQRHFNHTKEYTNQFDAIEDEAAAILAGAQAPALYLNGLKQISEVSARKIAKAKIGALFLNGLKELSIGSAQELGKAKCDVYLEGLIDISDPCLEFLAKCKAGLSLGLSKISDKAGVILGKRKKGHLYLPCLLEISDQAAKSLSRHQGGNLGLDGLKKLSNGAVKYLCEHQSVSLTSVLEVSDEALGHFLAAHQKGMDLSLDGRTMERIKKIRIAQENQPAIEESEEKSSKWHGTLSLSIGFDDGYYVNANLSKGIGDSEVLRAIQRCKKILKKPKRGEGFVVGWSDISGKSNGRLDQGDESSALMLFGDIEEFMGHPEGRQSCPKKVKTSTSKKKK